MTNSFSKMVQQENSPCYTKNYNLLIEHCSNDPFLNNYITLIKEYGNLNDIIITLANDLTDDDDLKIHSVLKELNMKLLYKIFNIDQQNIIKYVNHNVRSYLRSEIDKYEKDYQKIFVSNEKSLEELEDEDICIEHNNNLMTIAFQSMIFYNDILNNNKLDDVICLMDEFSQNKNPYNSLINLSDVFWIFNQFCNNITSFSDVLHNIYKCNNIFIIERDNQLYMNYDSYNNLMNQHLKMVSEMEDDDCQKLVVIHLEVCKTNDNIDNIINAKKYETYISEDL